MTDKILPLHCSSCEDNKKEKIYLRTWYALNAENTMHTSTSCSATHNARRMITIAWLVCKHTDRLH